MKQKKWLLATLIWASWIFASSCTVVTRDQFIQGASNVTQVSTQKVATAWESVWWVFVKGYHVLEYTILTGLLLAALPSPRRRPLIAALIAVGYAATDEWHQTFVPHRGGHFTDVLIDSLGVLIALMVFWLVQRTRHGVRQRTP